MTASCLYLLSIASTGVEAVRIRNALVHETGKIQDFTWTPAAIPPDFKKETGPAPLYLKDYVEALQIDPERSAFQKIIAVSRNLIQNRLQGRGIQSDTVDTLKRIQSEGIGYCADYTQVINGIAHIMEIPVREWGMSFDGYSGDGHAFSEIFDTSLNKWIFIDVFYGFYLTGENQIPLSVLEFRDYLKSAPDKLMLHKIDTEKFGFKSESAALSYYERGMPQLFLIWGNNVFSYDRNYLIGFAGKISRALEQAAGIVTGIHPRIRLYPDAESSRHRSQLLILKYKVLSISLLNTVFGIVLLILLIQTVRQKK